MMMVMIAIFVCNNIHNNNDYCNYHIADHAAGAADAAAAAAADGDDGDVDGDSFKFRMCLIATAISSAVPCANGCLVAGYYR